jgi:hypothetical protein
MNITSLVKRQTLLFATFVVAVVATAGTMPSGAVAVRLPQAGVAAHVARNLSISETVTLRLIGHPGRILNERGPMSGTYDGSCEARLVTITNRTGEATVSVVTSGGSLTAKATTRARSPQGATASFYGTASIVSGTGRWAHASGSLAFDGTVDRQNFHATAQIHGTLKM